MLNAARVPLRGGAVRAHQGRPAAKREHRLVRRDRPDRHSARSTTCRCAGGGVGDGLSLLLQLPRPERHRRGATAPSASASGANYNQRLANDRLNLRFSLRGSRQSDRFTPLGVLSNAAQYGPTQPINDPDRVHRLLQLARHRLHLSRQSGRDPESRGGEGRDLPRASATCTPSIGCPWVNGLRANATLGFDASDSKRRNFTPSTLHRELATGRGGQQTRYNPQQTSTVLETYLNYTTPKPLGPGLARPHRRLFLEPDPLRLGLLRGERPLERPGRQR